MHENASITDYSLNPSIPVFYVDLSFVCTVFGRDRTPLDDIPRVRLPCPGSASCSVELALNSAVQVLHTLCHALGCQISDDETCVSVLGFGTLQTQHASSPRGRSLAAAALVYELARIFTLPLSPLPLPDTLPWHAQLTAAVRRCPHVAVVGATGCGKSTQVPPALAAAFPDDRVLVLQPRRLPCTRLAEWVARTHGWTVGREVGVMVGGHSQFTDSTRITFATSAAALTRLCSSAPWLWRLVVADEVHERGLDTDLVVAAIKSMQAQNTNNNNNISNIRLVTMSATADAALLAGATVVPITQVAPLAVTPLAWGDGIVGADECNSIAKELSRVDRRLVGTWDGHAATTKCLSTVLDGVAKSVVKSIIHTITSVYDQSGVVRHGYEDVADGGDYAGILVFLPSMQIIREVEDELSMTKITFPGHVPAPALTCLTVHTLHSTLSSERLATALSAPPRPGTRKLILATNIAESSLTAPGVGWVIDSSLSRARVWSPRLNSWELVTVLASNAARTQRRGRVGRVGRGVYLDIAPRVLEQYRPPTFTPEITQSPAELAGLDIRLLTLLLSPRLSAKDVLHHLTPQVSHAAVEATFVRLESLGLIARSAQNTDAQPTVLGHMVGQMPVDLHAGTAAVWLAAAGLPVTAALVTAVTAHNILLHPSEGGIPPPLLPSGLSPGPDPLAPAPGGHVAADALAAARLLVAWVKSRDVVGVSEAGALAALATMLSTLERLATMGFAQFISDEEAQFLHGQKLGKTVTSLEPLEKEVAAFGGALGYHRVVGLTMLIAYAENLYLAPTLAPDPDPLAQSVECIAGRALPPHRPFTHLLTPPRSLSAARAWAKATHAPVTAYPSARALATPPVLHGLAGAASQPAAAATSAYAHGRVHVAGVACVPGARGAAPLAAAAAALGLGPAVLVLGSQCDGRKDTQFTPMTSYLTPSVEGVVEPSAQLPTSVLAVRAVRPSGARTTALSSDLTLTGPFDYLQHLASFISTIGAALGAVFSHLADPATTAPVRAAAPSLTALSLMTPQTRAEVARQPAEPRGQLRAGLRRLADFVCDVEVPQSVESSLKSSLQGKVLPGRGAGGQGGICVPICIAKQSKDECFND